jgi:hypothetical protein
VSLYMTFPLLQFPLKHLIRSTVTPSSVVKVHILQDSSIPGASSTPYGDVNVSISSADGMYTSQVTHILFAPN